MKQSKEVTLYIKQQPILIQRLMVSMRKLITQSIPDIEESLKFGVPFYTRKGLLCYLSPLKKKDGIYIGFVKGYKMSDDSGIFSGKSLKQIRHVEFRKLSDIKKKVLKEYLEEAVVLNEIKNNLFAI